MKDKLKLASVVVSIIANGAAFIGTFVEKKQLDAVIAEKVAEEVAKAMSKN